MDVDAAPPDEPDRARPALSGPLRRRGSDRIERLSRLVCTLVVLAAVPLGIAVGSAKAGELTDRNARYVASVVQRDVVVLETARATPGRYDGFTRTTASWSTGPGGPREGVVVVPVGSRAGQAVTAWFDRAGEPARPPLTGEDIGGQAGTLGLFVIIATATGGIALHAGVRVLLDRVRYAQWEAEWRSVERLWTDSS